MVTEQIFADPENVCPAAGNEHFLYTICVHNNSSGLKSILQNYGMSCLELIRRQNRRASKLTL